MSASAVGGKEKNGDIKSSPLQRYPLGGPGGNGGTVLIWSWNCNFSIYLDFQVYYLDIQAKTTLYAFYWFFMCCYLLFIQFSMLQQLSWKVTFSALKRLFLPEFWTYFWTYKDRTRFNLKRNEVSIQKYP